MELPSLGIVNDEELMEEALAILDSVDIERLGASAPEPALTLPEVSIAQDAAANDLLKTAVEAVHAAYPDHEQPHRSKSNESKSQGNKEDEKAATPGGHSNNQQGTNPPKRAPLQIYTTVVSTEKKTPRSRGSGGGRTRMREQLIQLRSVVQKMENHLNTLRSPRSPRFRECLVDREAVLAADENDSSGANGGSERTSDITGDAAVWRNIAMQQFRARRQAELQNAELRESLEAQIQLSKQVENLIQAHQTDPNLVAELPSSSKTKE